MQVIPMHQAKSTLSQLVKIVSAGEVIFIGGYGKAEVALVPAASVKRKKRLGVLAGKLEVPDDFDAPLPPELLQSFEADL